MNKDQQEQNECLCAQAACGCAKATEGRCTCGEVCNCQSKCRCADPCDCASKK